MSIDRKEKLLLVLSATLVFSACSSDQGPADAVDLATIDSDAAAPDAQLQCPQQIDGRCVGVAKPTICDGEFCTAGASCGAIIYVKQDSSSDGGDGSQQHPFSSLSDAADAAEDGDCIAVASGAYAAAAISGGVSVLGAGTERVTIDNNIEGDYGLRVEQGAGGLLRGFSIGGTGRGMLVEDATDIVIENLRFSATAGVALHVRGTKNLVVRFVHLVETRANNDEAFGIGMLLVESPEATISGALIEKSASAGLLAVASPLLVLRASMVLDNGHFGVGLDCGTDCDTPASHTIEQVEVARNAAVGVFGRGIALSVKDSDVGHTRLADGSARNIELSGGAQIELTGNRIHHSEGQGLLIDSSGGLISNNEITENAERGLWMQSISTALAVADNVVVDNAFVGVGATSSEAVTISGGRIDGTRDKTVLVGATTHKVGDGLQILKGSKIEVKATTLANNARVGLLIDAAIASVSGTTISGGLDQLVVQNASLADQTLSDNKDSSGKLLDAVLPPTKYFVTDASMYVGVLPIPLP